MSYKRTGYSIVFMGGLVSLISLTADLLGIGSGGVQAAQILGAEIGFVIALLGFYFTRVDSEKPTFAWRSLPAWAVGWVLKVQPQTWILVSFLGVYAWLFVSPVFLSPDFQMKYFNRFLPHGGRIGMDMIAIVDYIHNWLVLGESPYTSGFIAYPPFAFIFFSVFLLIGYPSYFYIITILTLAGHLISALVLPLLISNRRNESLTVLVFVAGLFSYGFQFELERAQFNVIAFTFAMVSIYLFFYHPKFRLIAYLFISISIQLKIYPAIFLIFFMDNRKKWRENLLRMSALLSINFAALFLAGSKLFVEFLGAVRSQQSYGASWNGNHSIQGFVNQLVLDGFRIFPSSALTGLENQVTILQFILLTIFGACLISIIRRSGNENSGPINPYLLVVCTVGALVIPSVSNDYKLSILAAPMALLFTQIHPWDVRSRIAQSASILLVVIAAVSFWILQYPFKFKPEYLTRSFLPLFTLLIAITLLQKLQHPISRNPDNATSGLR